MASVDLLSIAITLLVSLVTYVAYYVYVRYQQMQLFRNLGIPGPKPHFFKGNTEEMRAGGMLPVDNMTKWYRKYGKIFGCYKGTQANLVIGDLELIKQIFIKDFANFVNRFRPAFVISPNSVLNLEGQRWREVRKTLTPTFSASKLKQITHLMNRAVVDFGDELSKLAASNEDVDIYDRFQRLTLDVIGETALAMKVNCQREENNSFYESARDFMRVGGTGFGLLANYVPEIVKYLPFLFTFRKTVTAAKMVIENLRSVIRIRKSQHSKKTLDMLQLLLEASEERPNGCRPLSEDEIVDNCWVFILAGFETTATALSYVAYLLSIHQDVQEKVYQEIMANILDTENPTYDDANNLQYLNQTINEALRLYPPVVLLVNRLASSGYEIDGKVIPKGVTITVPIHCLHHDPDLWPEPEKFDPERFSPENKGNIHQMCHLPFGLGPRNCIGMRFALLEIKLTLIRLLTKNKLVQSTKQVDPPQLFVPHVTYVPKNGVFVKVVPRL